MPGGRSAKGEAALREMRLALALARREAFGEQHLRVAAAERYETVARVARGGLVQVHTLRDELRRWFAAQPEEVRREVDEAARELQSLVALAVEHGASATLEDLPPDPFT
jgi:hypothetical protein